jgi:hypothetical protein
MAGIAKPPRSRYLRLLMNHVAASFRFLVLVNLLVVGVACGAARAAEASEAPAPLLIGGVGGAYFLAEPGELVIDLEKRDLNRRDVRTELRAILAGPDRRVIQEVAIPDDGWPRGSGRGPAQRVRLATRVERKGVYALNVTVSQDRYGQEVVWGLTTNCGKYVIETARGHKDERHQEPIVLASPGRPAGVCFSPRSAAFAVDLTGLPADAGSPQVFDAQGALLATATVNAKGEARFAFAAAARPNVPWRLQLPSAQATIDLDGVTRWDADDAHPDLAVWALTPARWFPLLDNRWLLTPYQRRADGPAGKETEVAFQVRNDSTRPRTILLALEFPGQPWPARLATERVSLGAKKSVAVAVRGVIPPRGAEHVVQVRATPADDLGYSTYSTLTLRAAADGPPPPLALPIVLQPYRHENEQFGHWPDFPVENKAYFDGRNRAFIRTGAGLATWRDAQWQVAPVGTAPLGTKVAFDRNERVYLLATSERGPALQCSADGGRTFASFPLPARERSSRSFEIEEFTGHNLAEGPPPILRYTQTAKDAKLFWRALHDLELFLPRWEGERLVFGEPILLSKQCIGLASHSGIPASVVSRGSKVHVVWGEATDPAVKVAGVPVHVVTYDRETGRLGQSAIVGYGAPANDIHNSPSITIDRGGYLHVLGGTHGKPFPYARSLQPNDAGAGWTEAVPVDGNLNQTYVGLVCGPDDTLHAVFRMWRNQVEPFPLSSHGTLAYQRKRPGQPWEAPRVLVVAPFSEYSVFYHRLTLDRRGRLFVSYDTWSTFWFYRNDHLGRRRTTMFSPDAGDTWRLARTADLE